MCEQTGWVTKVCPSRRPTPDTPPAPPPAPLCSRGGENKLGAKADTHYTHHTHATCSLLYPICCLLPAACCLPLQLPCYFLQVNLMYICVSQLFLFFCWLWHGWLWHGWLWHGWLRLPRFASTVGYEYTPTHPAYVKILGTSTSALRKGKATLLAYSEIHVLLAVFDKTAVPGWTYTASISYLFCSVMTFVSYREVL